MNRLLLCALLALLTACASAPKPSESTTPTAPQPSSISSPSALNQWFGTRTGRLSVRAPNARGNVQNWHAGFEFVGAERTQTLRLTDPLGTTLARIEADANGARMTTSRGEQTTFGSLAELTQRLTGVALPDSAWRYWLMGWPAPDQPHSLGYAGGFLQAGFTVNVVSTFENSTPRVIEITRPDTPELQVRIALEATP